MKGSLIALVMLCASAQVAYAQGTGTLIVTVHSRNGPVASATVTAAGMKATTNADGIVTFALPPGRADVVVTKEDFDPNAAPVQIRAGQASRLDVMLEPESELEENVVVSATRTEQRVQDIPLRVEVVPPEEVREKTAMSPGDVSMLLAETNGLRMQTTSPALGGASLRIQGLSGRYSQILSDGLPLYGAQSGSVGILQIPPMDLGQVEVIKGVASALYGMSAIGGVVNLVSRRPKIAEHQLLVNRTSHRGTDTAFWLAQPVNEQWNFSVLGGAHWQQRSDLNGDAWADLPMFRRLQARPRVSWDNGAGRSLFATVGVLDEDRRGGASFHPENLRTRQVDGGFVGRLLVGNGRVVSVRGSSVSQRHDHTFGGVLERARTMTSFGEVSVTGTTGRHTWVTGAALQRETFDPLDVPRFAYRYTTPGIFAQDDVVLAPWLTGSASARADHNNVYGTFFSPRLSLLFRPSPQWTARVSGGRGHFAPKPFTDESDATGLSVLAPMTDIRPEDATSLSTDVTWRKTPVEVTTTIFHSTIARAQVYRPLISSPYAARIVNAETPTRNNGGELIARYHEEELDLIATYMYLRSTEVDEFGTGRRDTPLNPRHTATFDLLWASPVGNFGFEGYYTGRQTLEENPYRTEGRPYVIVGLLYSKQIGPAFVFVNVEDVGDVRQTKWDPLLRPLPLRDGRRPVDEWAPIEGRAFNSGLQFRF